MREKPLKEQTYKDKQKTKRQIMNDQAKKAIAARDAEVKKAKKELYSTPKIPGTNRAAIRKFVRNHKLTQGDIKAQKKRDAYRKTFKAEENEKTTD